MSPPSLKYSTNMYVNDVKNDTLHNKNKIKLSLSMNVLYMHQYIRHKKIKKLLNNFRKRSVSNFSSYVCDVIYKHRVIIVQIMITRWLIVHLQNNFSLNICHQRSYIDIKRVKCF